MSDTHSLSDKFTNEIFMFKEHFKLNKYESLSELLKIVLSNDEWLDLEIKYENIVDEYIQSLPDLRKNKILNHIKECNFEPKTSVILSHKGATTTVNMNYKKLDKLLTDKNVIVQRKVIKGCEDEVFNGVYIGSWNNGKREGNGRISYDSPELSYSYQGSWVNDLQHGFGIYDSKHVIDGIVIKNNYIGEWEKGQFHGKGKLTTYDNDNIIECLEGTFNFDKLYNGKSIEKGCIREGQFREDDEMIVLHGTGKKSIINILGTTTYEGDFINDKLKGMGIMTSPNGIKERRLFDNDNIVDIPVLNMNDSLDVGK
jgi:hypothetical protein